MNEIDAREKKIGERVKKVHMEEVECAINNLEKYIRKFSDESEDYRYKKDESIKKESEVDINSEE